MGDDEALVDCSLARLILDEGQERQYLFLAENHGARAFPIVIGSSEALEIQRVLRNEATQRPLTHQLAFDLVGALESKIARVDIVALRHNTFFARITLENATGDTVAIVDARPSDAIALALRARCQIRVAETVLAQAAKESQNGGGKGGTKEE